MGRAVDDPNDIVAQLADMRARIEKLENRKGPRRFTTAERPAPAELPYTVIANTTTGKPEWSNGVSWNPLYLASAAGSTSVGYAASNVSAAVVIPHGLGDVPVIALTSTNPAHVMAVVAANDTSFTVQARCLDGAVTTSVACRWFAFVY